LCDHEVEFLEPGTHKIIKVCKFYKEFLRLLTFHKNLRIVYDIVN